MKTHAEISRLGLAKTFLTLGIVLTLTSTCNLPQKEPKPMEEVVANIVAQTLTAQSIVEIPNQGTPTSVSTLPSAVTILTLPVTETPTVTPTLADDFKATWGNPTIKDTLDDGKGFGLSDSGYSDEAATITVSNGYMNLLSYSTLGWRTWRVRPPQMEDFYLEGKFITQSCASKDQFGLVFRAPNYDSGQGYYYGLHCNGNLSLARWDNNGTSFLLNEISFPLSNPANGQTNLLGVLARGNHLKLFINNKPLQELEDSTFSNGFFGVFIRGYSGNLNILLDELTLWKQ